jgi:NADPH2:quinone reductase
MGARVIGSVGSVAKADLVREYGAEAVIDYSTESVRDRVRELTGGGGADVIFDTVGGDVFDQSLRCIAWGGRLLVVGFTSGRIPKAPANLPLLKNCSIVGVFSGAWADRFPEEHRRIADTVMEWVAAGHLKPLVSRVMRLEDTAAAMRAIADRAVTGRIVLEVP